MPPPFCPVAEFDYNTQKSDSRFYMSYNNICREQGKAVCRLVI